VSALLGWQLLLIAVVDAEHFWLPDRLTLPLIGTGLIATALLARGLPWPQILGAVMGFGLLWLLAWLYRRVRGRDGLGGGDPILFAGAGAWVGWTGLPSVLLWACATGLCVVLWRLLRRRPVRGEDRLPFGTFLALGVWLTWLYGPLGF
jgi:leader peptidase (prepilin peptidase)/N-methyltransferase